VRRFTLLLVSQEKMQKKCTQRKSDRGSLAARRIERRPAARIPAPASHSARCLDTITVPATPDAAALAPHAQALVHTPAHKRRLVCDRKGLSHVTTIAVAITIDPCDSPRMTPQPGSPPNRTLLASPPISMLMLESSNIFDSFSPPCITLVYSSPVEPSAALPKSPH
jgi:hypothetical protein